MELTTLCTTLIRINTFDRSLHILKLHRTKMLMRFGMTPQAPTPLLDPENRPSSRVAPPNNFSTPKPTHEDPTFTVPATTNPRTHQQTTVRHASPTHAPHPLPPRAKIPLGLRLHHRTLQLLLQPFRRRNNMVLRLVCGGTYAAISRRP